MDQLVTVKMSLLLILLSSKRLLLNQEYIKRGQTRKGTVYGLGSVQYKNNTPSVPVQVTLQRNLDMEMRLSGLETTVAEVKAEICGMKTEFKAEMSAAKASVDMILQVLLSQGLQPQASIPTASTAQPSQPQPQAQGQTHPQPEQPTTDNQSDLSRWLHKELGI